MTIEPLQTPHSPPPPLAPPIHAGSPAAPPEPAWPVAVGVVSIVFGSLGGIGAVLGVVTSIFPKIMSGWAGPANPSIDVMARWAAVTLVVNALNAVMAAMLFWTGLLLLNRRAKAVRVARLWATIKMVTVVCGAVVGAMLQKEQFAAMAQGTTTPPFPFPRYADALLVGGVLVGVAFGWALPIFMLIWFSRPAVRAQTARWR